MKFRTTQMILKIGQEQTVNKITHHLIMDSRTVFLYRIHLDLVQWVLGIDQEICGLCLMMDLVLDSIRLMDIHRAQAQLNRKCRHSQEEGQEKISSI